MTSVGDINLDGFADAAECTEHDCSVYLGGRDGVQAQSSAFWRAFGSGKVRCRSLRFVATVASRLVSWPESTWRSLLHSC